MRYREILHTGKLPYYSGHVPRTRDTSGRRGKRDERNEVAQVDSDRDSVVPHKLASGRKTCEGVQKRFQKKAGQVEGYQDRGTEARQRGLGGWTHEKEFTMIPNKV